MIGGGGSSGGTGIGPGGSSIGGGASGSGRSGGAPGGTGGSDASTPLDIPCVIPRDPPARAGLLAEPAARRTSIAMIWFLEAPFPSKVPVERWNAFGCHRFRHGGAAISHGWWRAFSAITGSARTVTNSPPRVCTCASSDYGHASRLGLAGTGTIIPRCHRRLPI
jgi:hypothetical protein